jgi:hypothetical protein
MAGYASEVKLFGKWSFEDVEVRGLPLRAAALRSGCCAQTLNRAAAEPAAPARAARGTALSAAQLACGPAAWRRQR